jgi:hypothetical protein
LAVAEVHGLRIDDLERRRTLVPTILLGNSGASFVEKAAGRTGKHWGRLLTEAIPLSTVTKVNKVLGRWFVTKYGTKQGSSTPPRGARERGRRSRAVYRCAWWWSAPFSGSCRRG